MAEPGPSRLALLLRPLRQQEQEARQLFAAARQQAEALEADIRRCLGALAAQDGWAAGAVRAGQGAGGLAFYRRCVAELRGELARKRPELASAQETLQARRTELAQRMKQTKAMERLIERQEARAAADAMHKEVRELDQAHAAGMAWRMVAAEGLEMQA
jgi:flagellar export protein FliJ